MIVEPTIDPWLQQAAIRGLRKQHAAPDARRRTGDQSSWMPLRDPEANYRRLLDVVEEANYALLEQLRGTFIVVGQAVVGEQVSIAGV